MLCEGITPLVASWNPPKNISHDGLHENRESWGTREDMTCGEQSWAHWKEGISCFTSYPPVMTDIAIEHDYFIVDFPIKNADVPQLFAKLPEGIISENM